MERYHLAVDIGASSGRHILGWLENGKIQLKEVYRFENKLTEKDGHLCWEIDHLASQVKAGIKECAKLGFKPATMGIDTWAVDYVLLDAVELPDRSEIYSGCYGRASISFYAFKNW